MSNLRVLRVASTDELDTRLIQLQQPDAPALFLSGSIVGDECRRAVSAIATEALLRGIRLVLGANPSTVPTVLTAARSVFAAPDGILLFQSEFFQTSLPDYVLNANPASFLLIRTPGTQAQHPLDAQQRSLTEMRRLMISLGPLRGAVFVGGNQGTQEEARLFAIRRSDLPRYAVASTGSAALALYDQAPNDYIGTLENRDLLSKHTSYSLVARAIYDDLNIKGR